MKHTCAILLALVLLLGSVAVAEDAAAPRTLTVICPVSAKVEDYDTNAFILWLEEATGIDVTWIQVPGTSWEDKISTVVLSGDLPDVICSGNVGTPKATQQQWADEGIIIPLDDLIEEYGVYTKQLFTEQAGIDTMIRLDDGHIYALPTYSDIIQCNYSSRMWINDTFLEALGMEKPTTLEEFYAYLVGVRDNDVNGNGIVDDEIPYVAMGNWGGDLYTFIMNSFIPYNGRYEKVDIDENGTIYSVLNQDAFREGLSFLHKLYEEGLIYEGSISIDATGAQALGESGNGYAVIGCITGTGCSAGITGSEVYHQYSALAPLEGPDGLRQTPWYRYVNVREGVWMITSACEDVQTAFELGDFLYSYDSTMRLRHGEYGVSWIDAEEGQLTIDGRQAKFVRLIPYGNEVQNLHLDNDLMFYETRGVYLDDEAFGLVTDDLWDSLNLQWFMSEACKEYYIPYAREVVPSVTIPRDLQDEFNVISTDLTTYYEEWMGAFLVGEMDVDDDATWEEYLMGLNDIGLERYVEIYNEAYQVSPLQWGA